MPLIAVLDNLDNVDESLKPFYVEKDGAFHLDIDPETIKPHFAVSPLASAFAKTKEADATNRKTVADLKAKIAELEKGAPDTAATQAKIASLQEKLEAAEARANEIGAKYTGLTRDRALSEALQAAGVTEPAFVKASAKMLSEMVQIGEDGTAIVDTGMGPRVLGDFVKSWAASEGKAFVTPPSGGGAKGSDGTKASGTMKRADFENLDPSEQQKAMVIDKVTLVD